MDADLIRRVIANLVGNALRFSPRGGKVPVEVIERNSGSEVPVADQVAGIPPEFHQQIFEKFAQVKGTEAHGDQIGVESEVGR